MARRGLDLLDVAIHAAITFALCVLVGSAAQVHAEGPIAGVVAISLGVLAWRRSRSRSEPLDGGQDDRIAELEARLAQLEAEQGRVLELEERLDFAERLLVKQRDENLSLGPGGA